MPAASSARSRSCPAGPTKGWPSTSSRSPGCSPTRTSGARAAPPRRRSGSPGRGGRIPDSPGPLPGGPRFRPGREPRARHRRSRWAWPCEHCMHRASTMPSEFRNRLQKNASSPGPVGRARGAHRLAGLRPRRAGVPLRGGAVRLQDPPGGVPAPCTARRGRRRGPGRGSSRTWSSVLEVTPADVFTKTHTPKARGREQYARLATAGRRWRSARGRSATGSNLSDRLDTGLFLDHRNTRTRVMGRAAAAGCSTSSGTTGAFTVAAAVARRRPSTTTVDLSATYLEWAERNLELNGRGRWASRPGPRRLPAVAGGHRRGRRALGPGGASTPGALHQQGDAGDFNVQRDQRRLLEADAGPSRSGRHRVLLHQLPRLPAGAGTAPGNVPGADAQEPSARHPPARRPSLLARSPKATDAPAPPPQETAPALGPEADHCRRRQPLAPTACRRSRIGSRGVERWKRRTPVDLPGRICSGRAQLARGRGGAGGGWPRVVPGQGLLLLASPRSPCAGSLFEDVAIDEAFFAAAHRSGRRPSPDALPRGDDLPRRSRRGRSHPGLVVDRYGDFSPPSSWSRRPRPGGDAGRPPVRHFRPKGLMDRSDVGVRRWRLGAAEGGPPCEVPERVEFAAGLVRVSADLRAGQKTGAFLDQRENHLLAAQYARGKALDCFSYLGGFALQLATHAEHVTAVEDLRAGQRRAPGERPRQRLPERGGGDRQRLRLPPRCGRRGTAIRHHRARPAVVRARTRPRWKRRSVATRRSTSGRLQLLAPGAC